MERCDWGNSSEKMIKYHDEEWGIPVFDDRIQFEFLMLEAMQCGLSWNLMIEKREIFRECFDNFDYNKIALYTDEDIDRIMNYPGMIKSPGKIKAVISNAKCFLKIVEEYGSFSSYIWNYSKGKTILYMGHQKGKMPAKNGLSEIVSKDLKKRGFKYMGPVVVYSHLQSCGIINDHCESCFMYSYINDYFPTVRKRPEGE